MPASEDVPLAGTPGEPSAGDTPGPDSRAWPERTTSWEHSDEAGAREPEPGESGTEEFAAEEGTKEGEEVKAAGAGIQAPHPAEPDGGWNPEPPAKQEQNAGKVSWFNSFMRRNSKASHRAEPILEASQMPTGAETIPFPRLASEAERPAPPEDEYRTLDNARAAVRNVFASLGEQRPHIASIIQAPVTGQADAELDEAGDLHSAGYRAATGFMGGTNGVYGGPQEAGSTEVSPSGWEGEAGAEGGFAHSTGQTGFERGEAWPPAAAAAADRAEHSWLKDWRPDAQAGTESWQAGDEPDGSNELDAQLRDAMRAHFPTHASAARTPQAQFQEELEAGAGESPVAEALTAFWSRPAPAAGEPVEEPAALPEEESGASDGDASFDERLYREIEETREHANQPRHPEGKGGLALTAAWGLFLCVAGGLSAGLFAFRDIAADALPGLVPFYRELGMPVTVQPLIFEGVQYDWTVFENKPVLHIKGAVYNRAHRSVQVPEFVISVKDSDPALDQELPASLPVDGPKIGPDERSDFDIELLSPSPSITSVELELRDVQ